MELKYVTLKEVLKEPRKSRHFSEESDLYGGQSYLLICWMNFINQIIKKIPIVKKVNSNYEIYIIDSNRG